MAKLVILKFNGNFQLGFQVSLEIGQEGKSAERGFAGILPPAPGLNECLRLWQQQYSKLDNHSRIKPQQIIYDGSIDPQEELATTAKKLQKRLQQWLNSPSFYSVDKHLREELNRSEAIRILICSDLPEIYQLPWCCWDLLDNYPNSEIAISNFDFKRIPIQPKIKPHNKVRILAILGEDRGINLDADRDFLESLENGEVFFLVEPTRQELYARLWQETWDIVFFAGHSQTIDRQGILYLNPEDKLTIEQLKHGFKRAIANGLQLAIFNSCDGLGIAEELGKLFLPQSIVMRMPIPDMMAQEFIKYFLQAYAGGNSLYLATKMARERLQAWEKQYPCASWLPTIYQNPAIIPPTWGSICLKQKLFPFFDAVKLNSQQQPLISGILTSAIALILVGLIQSWGWLEAGELRAYDRLISYRFTPPVEERVLVITIDDRDIKYQQQRDVGLNMRGSLSDIALKKLVDKLQSGGAKAIASDVIHDFPFNSELKNTLAQTDNFFAICRIGVERSKLVSIEAPSSLPQQQIGFSNWAIDDDGAIRRQILGMSPDGVCPSSLSLSLRLALKYLDDIPAKYEQQGLLQIGDIKLPRLKATSGGYHLPEAQGYQTLLNYPRALPQTIPLREALTMEGHSLARLVKDKIILIGVRGYNQDLHHTPYSRGKQAKRLPGVIIHAQMTSQLISIALGEQKLLWWLCDRWEMSWIAFWCGVGSGIIILAKSSFFKIFLSISTAIILIFGCSWLLFLNGGWLIVIAPCLGLLLSAAIAAIYFRVGDYV
ncbi:CHASE2 domain-containing protein [Waterburya agarophytonicola K14]|uniref:CHASE2 domain-containing protein n=1 Tax=Waterburya agarophytonicola KI4 TaxID=2874699 RepID=A0A964FH99_9CYAN|nr:CHASE2 domain-containing protein [Waterburya agarophytonicola]MCC0178946.1 CHASE2 domain-containing protein [Waterburya agarophytonicola KI4]